MFSPSEAKTAGIEGKTHSCWKGEAHDCEFLEEGGCSIYEDRPLTCRLFGAVEDSHPLGCPVKPTGPKLSGDEADQMMVDYFHVLVEEGADESYICKDSIEATSLHDLSVGFKTKEQHQQTMEAINF